MRALAITGTVTAALMPSIMSGSLMRATPPCTRMSAGTRSRAMTADAPASSAILACSGVTTSMMTPPLSISASPRLTRKVPVARGALGVGWSAMDLIVGRLFPRVTDGIGSPKRFRAPERTVFGADSCPEAIDRAKRDRGEASEELREGHAVGGGAGGDLRRPAGLGQLHPRPSRGERDWGARGILVDGGLLGIGAAPRSLDELPVGEDPRLPLPHGDGLLRLPDAGHAHVGHELDHHVGGCHLRAVVVDVGRP